MNRITEIDKHSIPKKKKRRTVLLRAKKKRINITSNIEQPFSNLSEDEKHKVVHYCVDKAFEFYTSNNGHFS